MTLGYQALHEGAAYLDLSRRGKVFVMCSSLDPTKDATRSRVLS